MLSDSGDPGLAVELPVAAVEAPVAVLEDVSQTEHRIFSSWEEINEYLHGKYGYDAAIEESNPSIEDVTIINIFYCNGSDDDKFVIEASWYKHPQFQLVA